MWHPTNGLLVYRLSHLPVTQGMAGSIPAQTAKVTDKPWSQEDDNFSLREK